MLEIEIKAKGVESIVDYDLSQITEEEVTIRCVNISVRFITPCLNIKKFIIEGNIGTKIIYDPDQHQDTSNNDVSLSFFGDKIEEFNFFGNTLSPNIISAISNASNLQILRLQMFDGTRYNLENLPSSVHTLDDYEDKYYINQDKSSIKNLIGCYGATIDFSAFKYLETIKYREWCKFTYDSPSVMNNLKEMSTISISQSCFNLSFPILTKLKIVFISDEYDIDQLEDSINKMIANSPRLIAIRFRFFTISKGNMFLSLNSTETCKNVYVCIDKNVDFNINYDDRDKHDVCITRYYIESRFNS